jgi:hypothetical protein
MAASMIPSLLPMLANPFVAAGAVVAALGGTVFLLNEQFKKTTKEAFDLQMATGASSENLKKLSEFSGRVTAGEIMDRRRSEGVDVFQTAAGKTKFGDNFLQSETGKQMYEGFAKTFAEQGREAAASSLTNQMTTAVASGALSAGQARDIVSAIGKEMNDYPFSIGVNSKLLNLLGPNGENLLTEPLQVRLDILESSRSEITKFGKVFSEEIDLSLAMGLDQGQFVAKGAGLGATAGFAIGSAFAAATGGVSILVGTAIGAVVGGVGSWITTMEDFDKSAASIGQFTANTAIALQNQQDMVDSLQLEYEQRIANAKAAGDLAEAARLEKEFSESRNTLMLENAKTFKAIQETFASSDRQRDVLNQYESLTKEMYKDDPLMLKVLEGMESQIDALDDETEVVIRASLLSGDLTPTALQNMLSSGAIDKQVNLMLSLGSAGATQANQIAALFGDETVGVVAGPDDARLGTKTQVSASQKFTNDLLALSPEEAMKKMESFNPVIQSFSAMGEQGLAMGMSFYLENPELLEEANKDIEKFAEKTKDEPITLEIIQEVYGQDMVDKIVTNQEYFDSLPDDQKVTYTTVLKMLGEMDAAAKQIMAIDFVKSGKGAQRFKEMTGMTYEQYVGSKVQYSGTAASAALKLFESDYAESVTEASITGDKPTTKPTTKPAAKEAVDPYKNFLEKLKQIRNAAINAGGGLKEFLKVMKDGSATTSKFIGTDQKLLLQGYSTEFIDTINSMDAETRKTFVSIKNGVVTLTKEGKALNRALSEIKLGDFQFSLASGVAAINNQMAAMKSLAGQGMSSADAFEIVQDESLAYAIATAATTAEVKLLVDGFKELKKRQQEFQFSTPQGTQDWLSQYSGALTNATSKVAEFFNAQKAIVDQDFMTGANKSGRNKDLLNVTAMTKQIDDARNQVAEYQFTIDDLEYDLSSIAEKEDVINKKYDERADALAKIWEANSDIADQQKSQLDIADALASGDISAAARAIKEEQRRRAEKARADQERALEKARENELLGARSGGNKTRKQLEEEILQLSKKIIEIEEKKIEPVERSLRLAENLRTIGLEAVGKDGYLGKTEEGWKAIENAARLAVVQSEAFRESLKGLLRDIPGFSITTDKDGKDVVSFDEAAFSAGIPKPNDAPVTSAPGTSAPAGTTVPTDKPEDKPEDKPTLNTKDSSYAVVANALGGLYENLPAEVSKDARVLDRKTATDAFNAARTGGLTIASGLTIQADNRTDFAKQVMDIVLQNRALANDPDATAEQIAAAKKENIALMTKSGLKFAKGGMVPSFFGAGGFAKGTDTVPAMLTPGEFVMKRYAVDKYGVDTMKSINNGTFSGDSVYNYNLNVSVKSGANPDDIASAVMSRIKQIDSQRIRSNRY